MPIIGCIFEAEMFSDFMFLLLSISAFFVVVVVLQFTVCSKISKQHRNRHIYVVGKITLPQPLPPPIRV